ncbi:MAG: glucosyltransferase domain-containing protein, partial [Rudaea sp.]
ASAGLAYLLVAYAVLQFSRSLHAVGKHSFFLILGPRHTLSGAFALATAVGIYQSFALSFVTLSLALLLLASQHESFSWARLIRQLLVLAGMAVIAALIYEVADNTTRSIYALHDHSYLGAFLNWQALLHSPLSVTRVTFESMATAYGGLPGLYGTYVFALPALVLLGCSAIFMTPLRNASQRVAVLLLTMALLAAPFAQHFFAGGSMPSRTLVALPAVFWLLALAGMASRRYWLAAATFWVVIIALGEILYSSILLQTANYFVRMHDQQLAGAVYARIVALQPNFDESQRLTVDFYGSTRFVTSYPRPASSSSGFSFFEWDGGNEDRILSYMKLLGYTNLVPASGVQRQQDLALFKDMPVWPVNGSVRVQGDITLVKLGPTAGWPFNTQGK